MEFTQLYKSLVQSRWEHGMHLTPCTKKIAEEVMKVEGMFFAQIQRKIAKTSIARCRILCRILHPAIRRDILARKCSRRLIRRRLDLLHRPKNEENLKEIAEVELDIFPAKMNRYLYGAAEEATTDSNIAKYQWEKMKKAGKLTESEK